MDIVTVILIKRFPWKRHKDSFVTFVITQKKYVKIKHGLVKPLKPYNVVNFKLILGRLVIQKIPN